MLRGIHMKFLESPFSFLFFFWFSFCVDELIVAIFFVSGWRWEKKRKRKNRICRALQQSFDRNNIFRDRAHFGRSPMVGSHYCWRWGEVVRQVTHSVILRLHVHYYNIPKNTQSRGKPKVWQHKSWSVQTSGLIGLGLTGPPWFLFTKLVWSSMRLDPTWFLQFGPMWLGQIHQFGWFCINKPKG